MDNNTSHTAKHLVSLFLSSKFSLDFITLNSHVSIIHYIANCIDMEFKRSGYNKAVISRSQIAIYSRTSPATVKRAIPHLKETKIFEIIQNKGKKPIFAPGALIIGFPQKNKDLSTTRVTRESNMGHHDPTSNNASNNKDNNKGNLKNVSKNLKEKSNSLNSNHEKKSLRKMADKLGKKSNY